MKIFILLLIFVISLESNSPAKTIIRYLEKKSGLNATTEIEEFKILKKTEKTLALLKHYNETPARRFETLFFIAYPFSLIMVFVSVQVYGLTMAGDSGFQMNRTHSASVLLGSTFLSTAVAYKGYSNYKKRKQELIHELQDLRQYPKSNSGSPSNYITEPSHRYRKRKSFQFQLILGSISF